MVWVQLNYATELMIADYENVITLLDVAVWTQLVWLG